jgi:hypothetical protein
MDSPTTSGIGFSYTVNGHSVSPSQFARILGRTEGMMPQKETLRAASNDKTYQGAIIEKPSLDGAVVALVALAEMLGKYYGSLIANGLPEDYALRLTEEIKRPIFRKVLEGLGYTAAEVEQEMERLP